MHVCGVMGSPFGVAHVPGHLPQHTSPNNRVMEVMLARFTQEPPETPMLRWGKAGARGGHPRGDFVGMFRRSFRLAAICNHI